MDFKMKKITISDINTFFTEKHPMFREHLEDEISHALHHVDYHNEKNVAVLENVPGSDYIIYKNCVTDKNGIKSDDIEMNKISEKLSDMFPRDDVCLIVRKANYSLYLYAAIKNETYLNYVDVLNTFVGLNIKTLKPIYCGGFSFNEILRLIILYKNAHIDESNYIHGFYILNINQHKLTERHVNISQFTY
jgi:hypothetical protein